MQNEVISLMRFNNRVVAERAVRALENEGLNPVLAVDVTDQTARGTVNNSGGADWLVLGTPWAEADMASKILDEFLEAVDAEAEEEQELALGQS